MSLVIKNISKSFGDKKRLKQIARILHPTKNSKYLFNFDLLFILFSIESSFLF